MGADEQSGESSDDEAALAQDALRRCASSVSAALPSLPSLSSRLRPSLPLSLGGR
eukprot:COSAG01_NODE_8543_length_2748_cov_1.661382_2_plen_55_part_00